GRTGPLTKYDTTRAPLATAGLSLCLRLLSGEGHLPLPGTFFRDGSASRDHVRMRFSNDRVLAVAPKKSFLAKPNLDRMIGMRGQKREPLIHCERKGARIEINHIVDVILAIHEITDETRQGVHASTIRWPVQPFAKP